MNYFHRRRIKKKLSLLLKQARHMRNWREDVETSDRLNLLEQAERISYEATGSGDYQKMQTAATSLEKIVAAMMPARSYPGLRENIEMFIVAIAVAMAFRAYFFQPFRIPTSSMHPTLYGITYEPQSDPGLLDRFPLQIIRWIARGEWYIEMKARNSGIVRFDDNRVIMIGGVPHSIPGNMLLHVNHGNRVIRGQLLATGVRTAGDHILVNKIAWHFRRPRRGEIMVFKTDNISHPQIKENEHYVKRLVGLPDEKLKILEPYLYVDDEKLDSPPSIARMQDRKSGYVGYKKSGIHAEHYITKLGPDDFYALGDNQLSSLDSRYWGAVPRKNLVGPTFFIYWPFSRRWGVVD